MRQRLSIRFGSLQALRQISNLFLIGGFLLRNVVESVLVVVNKKCGRRDIGNGQDQKYPSSDVTRRLIVVYHGLLTFRHKVLSAQSGIYDLLFVRCGALSIASNY